VIAPGAALRKLAGGLGFVEGPVWVPNLGALLFTDIPNRKILRWREGEALSTYLEHSHFAIGLYLDLEGRLLSCEHTTKRLVRYEADGRVSVLADGFDGQYCLNSTNDVTVRANDGAIFFTDPPFGIRLEDGVCYGYQVALDYGGCYVFKVTDDPKRPQVVTDAIYRPNGLCFSPDGRTLYVGDSSGKYHEVYAMTLDANDRAQDRRVFAVIPESDGVPDGMRCDTEGRVYVSALSGIYVYAPDGTWLGKIHVPEMVTNLCFGGADRRTLYITACTFDTATASLYAIDLLTQGAQRP
jgi:gluconolactonase